MPNPKSDGPRQLWLACLPEDPDAEPLTLDMIKSEELCEPPVTIVRGSEMMLREKVSHECICV